MGLIKRLRRTLARRLRSPLLGLALAEPSAPAFTTQPSNQSVAEGDNATLTSRASGYPTPTYQWQLDSGSGFANISGATNRILTLTDVELTDDGNEYRCVATNSEGSDTSDVATLTVTAASGLFFTADDTTQTVDTTLFTVDAT